MTLDPRFKAMLDEQAGFTTPPVAQIPVAMVRAGYRMQRLAQNVSTSPADVETHDLELAGAAGAIPARLYIPAGAATPTGLLIYFHGGGFVIGDLETHDAHCRRLATHSGQRLLAVDYRLAPEHPFPAAHDDALAALRWAFDHAAQLGADPARLGVGGDSAGGNLAASAAIELRADPLRRLKLQLLLYPVLWPSEPTQSRRDRDGPVLTKEAIAWFEACLAFDGRPDAHRGAPARAADLGGLPFTVVVTAGFDPLEDEGRDYAAALAGAGVDARHISYPSLIHDFYVMGDVSPAVLDAAKEAGAVIGAALGQGR